jgi:hypothetical protein
MFCPNLSDPNIKAQFESLQSIVPEYAYYLWDKYQGEVPAKYYNLSKLSPSLGASVDIIQDAIKNNLPVEVSSIVNVVETVPLDILGREDLFLSMKQILNENGILDELLINWAGKNKAAIGNVKKFKSAAQLEGVLGSIYKSKSKPENHIELKLNPLALESFNKWVKALEKYPVSFRDLMLTHAIKYLNPQRRSKYVLQLSEVALQNAYGIVVNKPHEANRIGKLYDQEVLATLSDAVEHEPSASGKGYWVHIPNTQKKNFGFDTYADFKKDTEFQIKFSEDRIKELEEQTNPKYYNSLVSELEKITSKKPVFYSQEPGLNREEANSYGFEEFVYVRVESSYSRKDNPFPEYLGENYKGYYIYGYNTRDDRPATKVIPITKKQAEEIWNRRIIQSPSESYEEKTRQQIYSLEQQISAYNPKRIESLLEEERKNKNKIELKFNSISSTDWDSSEASQYRTNVDTLRKLSPATWCTSGSMTEHYVENYDNYLLIVDGVTVAGIEVEPIMNNNLVTNNIGLNDRERLLERLNEINTDIENGVATVLQYGYKTEIERILSGNAPITKRKVKEVTSRANNGVAPIDHLDDVIAFFEKHNLDLNNNSVKSAQQLKSEGKVDSKYEQDDREYEEPYDYEEPFDYEGDQYYEGPDEIDYEIELERNRRRQIALGLISVEDTLENLFLLAVAGRYNVFSWISQALRNDERVARTAVALDPHNINQIDSDLTFYAELATQAVNANPSVWLYLPDIGKNLAGLAQVYRRWVEVNDLPFSKTNTNQIQGYYDSKTDKVVVVASNVTKEEAPKVAIHEVAHRGMIRMAKDLGGTKELYEVLFNSEKELMKKLPDLLKRTGHTTVENLVKDYGFSLETEDGKAKLLMELAARWAETLVDKPKPSWWKQFLTGIQQWVTKFTGKTLNEKEVNELVGGFVRYGSKVKQDMPTTMFSRKDAKFVSNRFIRLERQYDFLKESQMDSEYWKLPSIAAKKQYLAKKQFDTVVKLVEGRNSVQVVNNKIYLSPTKAVQGGKVLYGYATGLAEDINKMYPLVTDASAAYVREDFNGRIYVEFDLTGRYATLLVEGVEFLEEETMRAEIELMDIQDAIRKEKAAIMEKLESANEVVIDGEVYAYTGSMFQKSFGLTQALKDPKIKDYTKVLNKLVSKFPGVTWKWNTDIVEVAKVNLATGQIEINPNLIQEDTPWHEFGHFVVRGIRESNPELFEQLKKEIEALHNEAPTSSSYSRVEVSYPEYIGTDSFWEEAIVTELGRQAAKKENRSLFDKIFDWFQGLLKGFNKGVSQTSNMSNLVDSLVDSSVTFDTDFNEEAVSDYMFQRIVPAEEVDALTSYVKISPNDPFVFKDYAEKVQVIANAISETEFKKILDTNKYLGLGSESLQRALAAIKEVKNIVTKADVAASVLELADYLQYSALYLTGVVRHLNNIIEDPNIPSGKKLGDLHRGYKQALAIEKHIKKIEDLFTTRALDEMMRSEVQKDAFLKNLSWMRTAIATIKNGHNNKIIDPVIDELAETFKAQSKDIEASFDRDIDKLKTRTQTDTIIKRIKELELEKQNSLLTPANIKKFLADTNSPWYLAIDSAMATKNPGVQLIANYIRSINNEFQENLKPIASEWQDLMDDIAASEGGFVGSALQTKKFFEPFIRETVLYEVIDGELVKNKKVLSLNTEVKTVELGNRITELKHAIDFGATEEIREQAEEDLKKFYEEYTERPFTDDYYEIQKLLPDDIKFKRNQIYQELAAIREEFGTGIIEDEILERLRDKEQELYELERLYTEDGTLKEGRPLEDALAIQAWKEGKRSADVVSFVLTPDSKSVFERMLVDKKAQLAKALAAAKTPQQKDDAHKAYNNWASIYTRTVYTQEFYDTRQDILDEIQELRSDRGSLSDKYSELFNLLLGTRDTNGVYNPVNVTDKQVQKAKEVEEEIEEIKALLKQDSPLSLPVKTRLGQLIEQLQALQSNVNSEYYTNAVDNQLKTIRTKVFTEHTDWDVTSVEREANVRFKNSDWYRNNHITKYRYNPETRSVVAVEEPIFMWRVTRPNDLKYIETDAPSSLWYKSIVNPKYKNDNYKPGEVTFKAVTGGIYHNSGYNNLSSNQKALLGRMKQLHSRSQEGLYQKDKLGDLIPGMRKTRGEFVDLVKLKANTIKQFFKNIKNWFTGDRENFSDEDDIYGDAYQTDAFGDPVVRESRRLFNRYARTLPLEEQSYDIMTAMASYATSSERFKVMRKYQSTVLTMEEVFNQGKSESLSSKVIRDLVDRELYGKVLEDKNDSKLVRQTNSIISGVSSIAGFKTLGFNLLSLPQNWINGYLKIFSQLGFYHITAKDMAKAFGDTSGISKEFYLSYNQFGNKSYRVSLVDYFTGTQSTANQASELNNKGLVKYGKAWKAVSTLRDFTEFDISAVTTYAFLNKYRVPLKGSTTTIPLKDAFEQVNGVIQPKNNVDIDFNFIQQVRMNIQLANERAQGVYSPEAQPTAMKNAWFRSLMFLKKWIIPDFKTTWGTDTVHYGAGIRTIGSHQAAIRFMRDIVLLDKGNFVRTWSTSSEVQQAGLKQFAVSLGAYTVLANLIVQMSLAMDCEEDAEADWKDYVCLGLKRTTNEAEGVFTLWGMNEMKFTYISEQANGVSIFEKLGWAALGPFSVWRKFWTDDDLFTTEPYYRYKSNSNKVDWDKTHPMQAGQNGLAVLGMEFLGLRGSFIGPKSVEFQNRAFNDYAPKTYTKELRTRYKKDHEGLEIMPTRTRLAQEKKFFKKQLKEIQEEIRGYKAKGEPVPINLENKLIKLRDSYRARVEDIKEGNIEEGSSIAYPFMDILGDRRGLDITPEPEEE